MSSRRPDQDQYISLAHTLSRRLQDLLKTSCQNVFTMFSRRLEGVLQKCLQDVRLEDVLQ